MPTTGVWRRTAAATASVLTLAGLAGCMDGPSARKGLVGEIASPQPTDRTTAGAADAGSSYDPTFEDERAMSELMAARAAAVREHDLEGFRATVDPRQPKLVADQTVLFRNLVALRPDSLWYDVFADYVVSAPVPGEDPVAHPQVLEHLKLRATMSRPVANELDLTFVKRDDQWLVGAERAPAGQGPMTLPQERPWFGAPIAVRKDGGLTVLVDLARKDRLAGLVEAVQDGIQRDADLLGVPPATKVLVDATSNGVASDFGAGQEAVSAVTFLLFADINNGRDTGYDPAGVTIKLNPGQVEALISNDQLLRHELAHFLLLDYAASPVWLREGVASWAQWQPTEMSGLVVADVLNDRLQRAKHELPAHDAFYDRPAVNYLVGQAAVQWLVDRDGTAQLRELMATFDRLYGGGDTDALTDKVLRRVYGISEKELVRGTWETLSSLHHE